MTFLAAALYESIDYPDHPEHLTTCARHLDERWVEEALEAHGVATLRRRRLPAEKVIWLAIGMALLRNCPIADVVSRLDLALPGADGTAVMAPSSVAEARQRVGSKPVEWLFRRSGRSWAHASARRHTWRNLALYAVDGTTLRVADSEENRSHFGLSKCRGDTQSGYPIVRMVVLMALRSHLLASANFGPYDVSEQTLANSLWQHVPDDSLMVMDRGFFAARNFVELQQAGRNRHWLTRTKKNTKFKEQSSFGRWDKLVEYTVSNDARAKDSSLPKTLQLRAVSYKHSKSKGRQWLLTSLIDPKAYPAKELVALYHERWEIEIGYDEIKTHMLDSEMTLRSRKVDGVKQELWGLLITYNLIRLEMESLADEAGLPPSRISFMSAMRFIRDEWSWCAIASPGPIPKRLYKMRLRILDYVLPPRRSKRNYPRALKFWSSKYRKKKRTTRKLQP